MDGTLTNSAHGILNSVQYALKKLGITVFDVHELTSFIGPPLDHTFMNHYGFDQEKALQAVDYYREYFKEKGLFENEPYSGIEATLEALSKKYELAVATSKPTVFAKQILDHFKLSHYFKHIVGSNLDNTRVNKDEVIEECLRLFNDFDSSKYLMIGDREHDINGAKKWQLKTVAVSYGYGSEEELKKACPDYLIANHSELLNFL